MHDGVELVVCHNFGDANHQFVAGADIFDVARRAEGRRGGFVACDIRRRKALVDVGRTNDVLAGFEWRVRIAREVEFKGRVGLDRVTLPRGQQPFEIRDNDRINQDRARGFQFSDILLEGGIDDLEIWRVRVGLAVTGSSRS
jgi:hypothetical protein